jgi:hypothetical protein
MVNKTYNYPGMVGVYRDVRNFRHPFYVVRTRSCRSFQTRIA